MVVSVAYAYSEQFADFLIMNLQELNYLAQDQLKEELMKCCGSSAWVDKMLASAPFKSSADLFQKAETAWSGTTELDWFEAFSHHPKIGDLKSLEQKFASTSKLAGNEQAAVNSASQKTLEQLAGDNEAYEQKFGFIFIVCATGKSAEEMLELLNARIHNTRETELQIAAIEQGKITRLRLEKLLS